MAQGESLWLHLDIIKELAKMCHSVFEGGDVRYAFTTIPTYPRSPPLPSPELAAVLSTKLVGGGFNLRSLRPSTQRLAETFDGSRPCPPLVALLLRFYGVNMPAQQNASWVSPSPDAGCFHC